MKERSQLQEKNMPRVSVIMTTFNSIAHVEDTLKSVLSQDYPDLEIVIADGGSTDGTVDVIRRYAEQVNRFDGKVYAEGNDAIRKEDSKAGKTTDSADLIDRSVNLTETNSKRRLLWVSEPDQGIYDGMNKAIRMSTGDIIGICNDLFTKSDAISLMVRAILEGEEQEEDQEEDQEEQAAREKEKQARSEAILSMSKKNPHVIGAHADLAYMDGNKVVRKWVMGQGRIEDGWLPAHPTMYLKREVYEKYGLYDLRFKSSSDYEFMVRVLKHPENQLAYVPVELIHMFYGGTSNAGFRGYLRNTREAYEALKANEIPHPGGVIVKRILRTLRQFR